MERLVRDGRLSMLMNMKQNQQRDKWTPNLVSMLKEISILYQLCQPTSILTLKTVTGMLSSRHQMEEDNKSGTSTNNLWQWDLDTAIDH